MTQTMVHRWFALASLVFVAGPVQAIVGGTPTAAFLAVGVGVQVAPDWVLTAQHVTLNAGATYHNGYGDRIVAARYDAPGSGTFPANDLSLLRLLPVALATPYLSINGDAFADGPLALDVTITSPFSAAATRGFAFTRLTSFSTLVDPDDNGPLGPVTANYLISMDSVVHVEGGDSGGGLFLGRAVDSTSLLLGINSARFDDENNVPAGSGFVQLASYRGWIDATMTADNADSQTLRWVSAVPEPASAALLAGGALLLAGWRAVRRRGA